MGVGEMELFVLVWQAGWIEGRDAKGKRNETKVQLERNEMKETRLRGVPRLRLTMNGMKRKVAEQSAALEWNAEKRKPSAAGIGHKHILPCTFKGWRGIEAFFCGFINDSARHY
jgi:post-segregation antitoxin (ccd killing protein)